MNICLHCQHENAPNANFCNRCGQSLIDSHSGDQLITINNPIKTKRAAERRQLTILFCDLVGSTQLSEQLDPEEYRQVIKDYHHVAEGVIKQYDGHIAQYLGDGLLVYFGYPEGLEDAPKAAVQTGLGILTAVAQANQEMLAVGKAPIKVRIGIHTGLVVVDEHLAFGEAVNVAAHLEGLAPHNGLVISPQTLNLVQGWFHVKSMGKQVLKGMSEAMEVYHVLKESGAQTRLEVAKSLGFSPLVGRRQEMDQLKSCWEQAKNGGGNLLLLNGEAGIGKSRLVDAIEEKIEREQNGWFCVARCSPHHLHSSFYPIIELLGKGILKFEQHDTHEQILTKLESFLLQTGLELKTVLPLLAEFLSIPSEHFPSPTMSPFAKRQRILESLTQVLLYRLSNEPSLFVLEDLHWADASTLEWLDLFIAQIATRPIFMLCTTRPAFQPDWEERLPISYLNLQRLSVENMVELCHHQTKGKILPKEILKQITTKTNGVPLFVEELTKMILESALMIERSEGFEVIGSLSSLSIPSTLQDSLLARLDRLSNVKELVQIGSVIGHEFSLKMLNAVLPEKTDWMDQALSKLLEAEIFYINDSDVQQMYHFKHALIQDAAYDSLLKSRRQELHNKVAHVLKSQFTNTIEAQPEILAYHFTQAGQPIQAIPIWLKAGQLASQKNATAETIAHLEKGLGLLSHIENTNERNQLELDFLLILGGTYVVSHGFPHPKVKETFNQARDIAHNLEVSPKLALILYNLLNYYMNTEDYKAHAELWEHMMKLSEDPEHGYWFELFANQLVSGGIIAGDFKRAIKSYERILELFDPSLSFPWELSPSGYLEIGAKAWMMINHLILGEMDQAKLLFDHHLSFAEHHKDSITLYHIYTFPALFDLEIREWKGAEEIIETYFPIVRAFGDPIFTLTAEVYYYIAKANQGDRISFDKAAQLLNHCFDIGFKAFAVCLSPYIGELHLTFGHDESAINWIDKILTHVNLTGSHIRTAELLRIKGLAFQSLGKPNAIVEQTFMKALELARGQSAKLYELRIARDLSRLWCQHGKTYEAFNLLKEVFDSFNVEFKTGEIKEVRDMLAQMKV